MKLIKLFMLLLAGAFFSTGALAQANASLNMQTLNGGDVYINGAGSVQITVGNTGPISTIPAGRIQVQLTAQPSVSFPIGQTVTGWTITPIGTITAGTSQIVNICNSSTAIAVNTNGVITINLLGGPAVGGGSISGQLSFRTNCTSPGSLAGNNTADDISSAGYNVVAAPACSIGVTASAGTIACNGGTTTLTATATGTANTVEYSLNGGAFQLSNTFTGVNAAGSPYTVTAREVATPTCTANSATVTVSQPALLVAAGSVTTPIATIGGTGVITISATGGTPPYTGTGTFNRTAGTYSFTVTDANSCTASTSVTISDPAACIITGVTATAGTILCNGGTTTITATASPAGTYQYQLNSGAFQSGNTFTVTSGSYTVTARETANPGCTSTSGSVAVSNPSNVSATAAVTTPIAVPGGTGVITVAATGGTGGKTYTIVSGTTINTTGAANGIFTGLSAGNYTFRATDANGCLSNTTVAITLANPGIASADPAVGGMFFTTTTGGVQSANNLLLAPSADLYDINIPFFNVNQVNPVPAGTINFTINLGKKLVLAPGFNLATAPLSTYFTFTSAEVGGNLIITGTQSTTTPIPADFNGIATFRVKGDSACKSNVVSNIVITNVLQTLADDDLNNNLSTLQYNLPITLSNTQINVTCNGAGNGRINVTVSSGTVVTTTGPSGYTNTQNIASGVNAFSLTGLAPGTYVITATAPSDAPLSAAACTSTNTVIISQPIPLAITLSGSTNNNCFNATDGTITVVANGGTAPYTYTIAPAVNTTGAINGIFTGLPAGSYVVTVTDNNGCTAATAPIIITQPIGGIPDLTLGSDFSNNIFPTPGVSRDIVFNIAEIAGNSAVGDTIRITKVNGYTFTFNPTLFTITVGGTLYNLDNTRWKIDNSDPAFVSIILTDPLNAANPGTILCNTRVFVAVSITRNTSNISVFPVSARMRRANGEVNLANNLTSILFTAE